MGIPINPIHLLILHSLLGGGRQQPNHFGWGPASGMGMGRPGMGGMGQQPNHFGWGPQGGDLLSQIMQMGQGGARATGDPMGFGGNLKGTIGGQPSTPWHPLASGGGGQMQQGQFQVGLPNNASSGGASNHLQGLLDMLNR